MTSRQEYVLTFAEESPEVVAVAETSHCDRCRRAARAVALLACGGMRRQARRRFSALSYGKRPKRGEEPHPVGIEGPALRLDLVKSEEKGHSLGRSARRDNGETYLLDGLNHDSQVITLFCRKIRYCAVRYSFEQTCAVFGGHIVAAAFVSA